MVSRKPQQSRQSRIFGPVRSRRLGLSLGIDLVPFKTCTFDCVYCQLGKTTCKTLARKQYVPASDVLVELENTLSKVPEADFITLTGSGEPTLHAGIGHIIAGIRSITSLPIAVLTNGSLFFHDEVRIACNLADVVLPSLDAWNEDSFSRINRPAPGLTFQMLLDGMEVFRRDFDGQIWLEVFLLRSLSDDESVVKRIARAAESLRPDRIHLNTAVRPTAEEYAQPVSVTELERFSYFFKPIAEPVFTKLPEYGGSRVRPGQLLEALKRRPCTLQEMGRMLNLPPVEITKYVDGMVSEGRLKIVRHGKDLYYYERSDVNED